MARPPWSGMPPIERFTDYYPPRTSTVVIRSWVQKRLRRESPRQLLLRLSVMTRETNRALGDLRQMSPGPEVSQAVKNAASHKAWLRLLRREVERVDALRKAQLRRGPPSVRVGLLAREASIRPPPSD